MFVSKPGAPAEPPDTRRCVPASISAGHRDTGPRYSRLSSWSRIQACVHTMLVMCCIENTAGSCCQPNPNPCFRSRSGTMLPRTRVPFGKCNCVVRLLHALTTARTACSSDTDHSFVLGIVLDSCNRSEHASVSGFSTWMQRVLPHFTPCTDTKDILLPRTSSQSSPSHQG